MEDKGKRIERDNGDFPLPEAMIQHVQSFMSGKEAAQTTVISKSWYNAWLTLPALDLDFRHLFRFGCTSPLFVKFAKKTVQRYQGLNLKIERFRLRVCEDIDRSWALELIVTAMNIGATDVELDLYYYDFPLPEEVLASQTLLRLSLSMCEFDGSFVNCSRLQSLILHSVLLTNSFKDIILCCNLIEELSVSSCIGPTLSRSNLPELPKLRRLILSRMNLDNMFFTDFASRFPCLKDLSILYCCVFTRMLIVSTSLETISFMTSRGSWKANFDVPNIRKVTYSGSVLPSRLSIKGGSSEWELDISINCHRVHKMSWFLNLKKSLAKLRLCRISVSLNLHSAHEHEVDIIVLHSPLVVENLMIDACSSSCLALLVRLFGIFRPKFLTNKYCYGSFAVLFKRLMQKPVTPNCGIPDQDMFGQFRLKKVNMEVYEMVDAGWLPLVLEKPLDPSETSVRKQKIRFGLIWD